MISEEVSISKDLVEMIKEITKIRPEYGPVDAFIEDAICKRVNELYEAGQIPYSAIIPLERRRFLAKISEAQDLIEDMKNRINDENLRQELDKLFSELGEVAEKFVKLFSGSSPHSRVVGEEEGEEPCKR